jgi:hypothetical protein
MNNGRIERILKDHVNTRKEFPKSLLVENKRQVNSSQSLEKTKTQKKESAELQNLHNDSDTINLDKKDAIPLLIIDVNIRPGVKKKIYVFDGDTPDGLSEKFSQEHSKN